MDYTYIGDKRIYILNTPEADNMEDSFISIPANTTPYVSTQFDSINNWKTGESGGSTFLTTMSEYYGYNRKPMMINRGVVMIEVVMLMIAHMYCRTGLVLLDCLTLDSLIAAGLFVTHYQKFEHEFFQQGDYPSRLVYLCLFSLMATTVNYITWWNLHMFHYVYIPVALSPTLMGMVLNSRLFKNIMNELTEELKRLWYILLSKRLAKLIRNISIRHLDYRPEFTDEEFIPFMQRMSVSNASQIVLQFLTAIGVASVIHYLELIGGTPLTAVFRQYYYQQYMFATQSKNIVDNREYLRSLLTARRWEKLVDSYTLNRVLQFYLETVDSGKTTFEYIQECFVKIGVSLSRAVAAWSILGAVQYWWGGLVSFFLMLDNSAPIIHTAVIGGSLIVGAVIGDQILLLFLCEICLQVLQTDLIKDAGKIIVVYISSFKFPLKSQLPLLIIYMTIFSFFQLNVLVFTLIAGYLLVYAHIEPKAINLLINLICTVAFSWMSSFHPLHCIGLPIVFNIIINCVKF